MFCGEGVVLQSVSLNAIHPTLTLTLTPTCEVRQNGMALQYASKEFQNQRSIVMEAVEQNVEVPRTT